ncbi:class I SAM-dependent methyltransferase [Nostoc sp. CENA67]|uniref:Class I SAM-dependent methyltransferase n=1 Tax=Amazonocrinis nigriterrae CENA67 TaxID=2794033 RepID=A0A8J7HLH8_9NOST|nr:class I SAM-dependent methyltransferase [Amazonocrinis nigriterrae]MBH8561821.1 class I SAM-dependent methyltransferase [Amazonocrinis nigriterrae CENA67]
MNFVQYWQNIYQKLQQQFLPLVYSDDLKKLSLFYGTKWGNESGDHMYAQHYEKHFAPIRKQELKILEIGIGGYDNPADGGSSLKLWKTYFPNSMIYGIDIVDKTAFAEDRIKIFQGSQDDEDFLKEVIDETGKLDIIIDDGSHINQHVIKSFKTLFPALKDGGIYIVEDTHTSYWPSLVGEGWSNFGKGNVYLESLAKVGGSLDLNHPQTSMNFFKRLIDGLNYEEFLFPGYVPSYFDKHIVAMHFYHNLVILYKGNNIEGSNILENNTLQPYILEALGINSLCELGLDFDSVADQYVRTDN